MPIWPWRKARPGVDAYGRSPLWHQAMAGDVAGMVQSLKAGADPTAADKDGFSALHVAAEYGHGDAVRRLIAAGADVNCLDRHGNGPLWVASRRANEPDASLDIVVALLDAGADMDHRNAAGRNAAGWAMRADQQALYRAAGYDGAFAL